VGEQQLGLDDLDVARRIDGVLDVHDVRVLEGADDVEDGVGLANVGQELVAEALALRRAAHQSRDVDDFEVGVDRLLALRERRAASAAPSSPTFAFTIRSTGICCSSGAKRPLRVKARAKRPSVKRATFFPAMPPARKTPPRASVRSAMFPASAP